MLNFDGRWDVSNPAVANEAVAADILLAIATGIPEEFPLTSVVFVIGGVEELEIPGRPTPEGSPPFSTRFPSLTYISPGVILQRLSSGKISVTITERIDDPEAASPPVVRDLARGLGAGEGKLFDVLSEGAPKLPPLPPNVTEVHNRFRGAIGEFLAGLTLPHELPDPAEIMKMPHAPVGEVRAALLRAFKPDGWKKAAGRGAGMHRLWKATPNGRRLVMDFDTGSWLRQVTGFIKLPTEAGVFRLVLPADRTMRGQYIAPNPEVFRAIVENLTAVVRELERTWVVQIEDALGPVPEGYQPPEF